MQFTEKIRSWARALKALLLTLWLLSRDARTPRGAKLAAMVTLAYALSPIDLIPDFIPVIGFLDDVLLVPLGVLLTLKLTPAAQLADCRQQAAGMATQRLPSSRAGLAAVIFIWLVALVAAAYFFWLKQDV